MLETGTTVDSRLNYLDIYSTDESDLLSESFLMIFQWILFTVVCQIVDIFGVATNIINIICFVKQGFKDPVNVSLLGLAVSDLGCVTTLLLTNICFTPAFSTADLPFDASELQMFASGWPHFAFSRTTCWITAFITVERCLCITLPLQIKDIITPKRVAIIIGSIFIILFSSLTPMYILSRLGEKFFPHRNKTLLGIIFSQDRENIEKMCYTINNVFVPFCAFSVIFIATIILVVKLRETIKWRQKSMAVAIADNVSSRNQKVAKMVVIISSLFIACFTPVTVIFIVMSLEPGFSVDGKYRNMLTVFGGLFLLFESINSSSNIFIYYHMSSRYRLVFQQLFFKTGTVSKIT